MRSAPGPGAGRWAHGFRARTRRKNGPIADLLPDDVEQDPGPATYDFGDDRVRRGIVSHQGYWRAYGTWRPMAWRLSFVVRSAAGEILGVQELEGNDFPTLRTVDSSSFLVTPVGRCSACPGDNSPSRWRSTVGPGRSPSNRRPHMEPDHNDRDAALARLEPLIGEWVLAASFPSGSRRWTSRSGSPADSPMTADSRSGENGWLPSAA